MDRRMDEGKEGERETSELSFQLLLYQSSFTVAILILQNSETKWQSFSLSLHNQKGGRRKQIRYKDLHFFALPSLKYSNMAALENHPTYRMNFLETFYI